MKKCSRCLELKSLDEFYNDKNKNDGKSYICKKCHNTSTKEWQSNNVEKVNKYKATSVSRIKKKNSSRVSQFLKVCSKCGKEKPSAQFYTDITKADGVHSTCKKCHNEHVKEWQSSHAEQVSAYKIKSAKKPGSIAKKKAYCEKPENKQAARDRAMNFFHNNHEQILAHRRSPEFLKRRRDIHAKDPTKNTASYNRRRARKANAPGEFTAEEFKHICEFYDGVCLCCGKKDRIAADHVVALSKGGNNYISNIQPLCKSCNSSKRTNTADYRPFGWAIPFANKQLTV